MNGTKLQILCPCQSRKKKKKTRAFEAHKDKQTKVLLNNGWDLDTGNPEYTLCNCVTEDIWPPSKRFGSALTGKHTISEASKKKKK